MKGKIDKDGVLFIERAGKMRAVTCPIHNPNFSDSEVVCGDRCAMFGEPEKVDTSQVIAGTLIISSGSRLSLCHKELVFEEFTDERPQA